MPDSIMRPHPTSRSRRRVLRNVAGLMLAMGLTTHTTRAASTPAPGTPSLAGPATVTGTIEFPANLPPDDPATISVRIEDVSLMDAPSRLVASDTLHDVPIPPAGDSVSFTIQVTSYDPRLSYSVRVHVDRDGDGQVSVGDLVSTSSHPVLTRGAGNEATIPVSVV